MMKMTNQFGLLIIFLTILMQGCLVEDPLQIPEPEAYFEENFDDLNIEVIQSVETPFQSVFQSSNARSKEGIPLEEISSRLAEIFPDAEVLEVEEEMERGISVWEIKLKMPGGGILKLMFAKELGLIVKIKGTSAPFDYEIDPGGSFIPFSEAANLAIDAVNGEIQKWELELEENNEWEYEIHLKQEDKRYEVEIKGFESEIISIRLKQDNDDVHGDEDHQDTPPDEVANFALSLFHGEVIHSEIHHEEEQNLWKLYIESETGSIVKFKILEEPVELLGMKSENGPFDYNIEPGEPYMSLVEATELAKAAFPGDILKWEFEIIHRDNNVYALYEFKLKNGDEKVEMTIEAETGDITNLEDDDHNGHNAEVPQHIAEFALGLFPGEIIEGHLFQEEDDNIWKLHIRSESGSVVRFLISNDPLSLIEMKAEEGPFNYSIDPGEVYISLEEAREIAVTEITGELIQWKFRIDDEKDGVLPLYSLYYLVEETEVKILINAESGEILDLESHDDQDPLPEEVASFALSLFPGEIIEYHYDNENDHKIWKIHIVSETGNKVDFLIKEDPLTLLGMSGKEGPFEYNIEPGEGFISLDAAREVAENEVDGELVSWLFKTDHDGQTDQSIPVYKLKYHSSLGEFNITVNAESGELIAIGDDGDHHDEDNHHDLAPESVTMLAQSYFTGQVVHSEKNTEENIIRWELILESESGAQVKFYILEDPLELLKMKGENAPFDYNIEPGDPYISLNRAIEISKSEFDGNLLKWEFRKDKLEDIEIRVYELHMAMEDIEVKFLIHAESGDILDMDN